MKLKARFPQGPDCTVDDLLADVTREPEGGRLVVGDERVRDFLASFSRRLLRPETARRFPELGSLGFFLRRGEIAKAIERLHDGASGNRYLPRGLVLHFPPANVDTIFVYSWALSALSGNANIVRVSNRSAGAAETVIDALNATLAEAHPAIAQTQRMVGYERDDAVTAALSLACDLRVIWGGDRSVTDIRRHPLAPLSRDLTFPDRSSFAAVAVDAWHEASAEAKRRAVDGFANDVYWFDQAACSSPRVLFWVGASVGAELAREEFMGLLGDAVAARGWRVDAAMAVEKHVATYGLAAEGAATRVRFAGNAVAEVELAEPVRMQRDWLGAGTICHATVGSLAELVPLVRRKDQTFSQFGFTAAQLDEFVTALAGRGVDRIVPFGSALTFASVWDGFDLLREFTRQTTIWPG
ncbi:acyl-CoA reductase [Allorhizocola rhizosphaerae]|uniref:acyl-CoA reductase n=1 Tax=Allorhizocola rhizosphaerae TaxID=1872709 RepID=UPI000E3C9F78|nr:acyl-CoA reductase [Allorhizocola rhizosphaerae]